jgi:4-hydroxybenzoate polyprenyltransferase
MNRYFALSRTTHGVLDLASPAVCALLWLGAFPPLPTMVLALFTAFAAYTAVYALNDLVGVRFDRERFTGGGPNPGYSVEASAQRYPLAQQTLSARSGAVWMGTWFALALIGSYLLNPVIAPILLTAAALEILYCSLLKVTYVRTLVSGMVKTCGPIAAVFVVDHSPAFAPLLLIVGWLFFWEIGGQNIPADWNDTEEDSRVGAKTIPVRFGFRTAGRIVLACLSLTVLLSGLLPAVSPARLGWLYSAGAVMLGILLLLRPAYKLHRGTEGRLAARLFDNASYYPLANLVLISFFLISQKALPG